MYKILIALFASSLTYAYAIENGQMSISVNNIVINSSNCSSFQDGVYEGIVSKFNDSVLSSFEFDTSKAEIISESPRTYSQKIGFISSEGFCAGQNFLNNLEIKYSKTQDEVKFEYTYRCHRKDFTRIISCKAI